MNDIGGQERRFLDALESLFTGAQVDGQSGFINLMRLKRRYFQSLRPQLLSAIDQRARPQTAAREELFDKLYTFFGRYFCESGSIYFRHLPAFAPTYQPVYADGQDVALSWKTQDLYYVKSDTLIRSMPVVLEHPTRPDENLRFYFDASQLQHKQNNEKRELLFQFQQTKPSPNGPILHLAVHYSQKGRKTNLETILKQARKAQPCIRLSEEQLQKACRVFRRQTEADFFIHKNARAFLREQFDLWMYQYLFRQETIFQEKRLAQLQALQQTAYDIIDWIAQFEDELRRIWEKPKFVRKVNYVITLDQLPVTLLRKLAQHPGAANQAQEWKELGMVEETFHFEHLLKSNRHRQHLPLDTKHFPSMKLEILATLGNLDEVLDGELVHSENWQALNTLRKRYQAKVKTIYIDPPYNTASSEIAYKNDYKHSSWLTLIENRLTTSKPFLKQDGVICCAIDDAEAWRLLDLLQRIFDRELGTIPVRTNPAGRKSTGQFSPSHEYALFFGVNDAAPGSLLKTEKENERYPFVDEQGRYAWANLIRSGSNDRREDRPKMFYPIYVKEDTIRIPKMEWNEEKREYHILEKPKSNETVIWPVREQVGERIEKNWHRGWDKVQSEPGEYRIRRARTGGINIDFRTRMDESAMPKTWWDKSEYASANYGAKALKELFGEKPFDFSKSIPLVEDCIRASGGNEENAVIADYFAGSGTTAHAVINLNREDGGKRKYVLVEMGDYFHTVLLPRIKKVVYSKDWKDGKPVSREGVSHCFKYYALEQYEETLRNVRYQDGEQLEIDSAKSPFEQYVFFGDDKLAHACQFAPDDTIEINLQGLYPDVDIAETLSNLLGKPIRRLDENQVTFADGITEKINPQTMTEKEKLHFLSIIKPTLWWGEVH